MKQTWPMDEMQKVCVVGRGRGMQAWPMDEELKDAEGVCRQHEMCI